MGLPDIDIIKSLLLIVSKKYKIAIMLMKNIAKFFKLIFDLISCI